MGNGPDNPGEWDSSGPTEPPAQLLRRAISHVESLLHRLESPEPSRAVVAERGDPPAPTEDAEPSAADGPTLEPPAQTDNVVELARPEPLPATPHAEAAEVVPLPGLSSTAQAEALRITLHAQEEANRLRAEANGLRAEAAAEGERILVEARLLSDRLHAESRESATELLQAARTEAAAIIAAARTEAEQIAHAACEETERARAEVVARAEQERADAKRAALDELACEAERIRTEAREGGRAEAARLVEAEVAAAAVEGRLAVEASRARAQELLATAHGGIEDVRSGMGRLLEEMSDALVGFNAAVGTVEQVHDAVAELAPPGPGEDDRRPLGLLFGAPRG